MCIKIKINMNIHILQNHKNRLKIQPPFNFISFIDGAFAILLYRTCHILMSRSLVVILFSKNETFHAFLSKKIFQSAMLIPSAALDICSEKRVGDRRVWLWVSETDTTVFSFTKKCKSSYFAVCTLLSCNNYFMTKTQVSVVPSLPSADVKIFNPFFFSLFSSLPPLFSIWM